MQSINPRKAMEDNFKLEGNIVEVSYNRGVNSQVNFRKAIFVRWLDRDPSDIRVVVQFLGDGFFDVVRLADIKYSITEKLTKC